MRRPKRKIVFFACAFFFLVALLFGPLERELIRSRLTIHAPLQGWRSVRLDGDSVASAERVVRISPISYGPHTLRIELADGKVVWATFFHSDTGVDRQLNVFVEHTPGSDLATVEETITRFKTFPGVTRTVFKGSVRPEHTSEAKPLVLDWI